MNNDINEILEKGNCDSVRNGGKEACINSASLRTEMSSEAEVPGKLAQHNETLRSGTTVDGKAVQLEFTFLSGEASMSCVSKTESGVTGNRCVKHGGVSRRHSTDQALSGRPELERRKRSLRCAEPTTKPKGGAGNHRSQDKTDSYDDLIEQILSRENMLRAWKRVKANKGAPGIDQMTIKEFPAFIRQNWDTIRESIRKGTYNPMAVRRVEIPKPSGGVRPLGIPSVQDRLVQQAVAQVIGPLFELEFSPHSYGFRPGKSAHQAIRSVFAYSRQGYTFAVDADLSKFFDRVNHDHLMRLLRHKIKDAKLLRLIVRFLRAGVIVGGKYEETEQGVPQGGPLSPLLANIVLNELDQELERRGHRFVRYADDFIILVKSKRAGERVFQSISHFIEKRLHLKINKKKSKVAPLKECSFLGFAIVRGKIRWMPEAEREFKRRIRELTNRNWGVSMARRIRELTWYIRGWINYFGISEYYSPIPRLDEWIRRRMRLCYWKMWKRPRKRMSELMKLGTYRKTAILTGRSRKGPWRLSRTLATQTGMTNAWLSKQGVLSLKELWVNIHYPNQG